MIPLRNRKYWWLASLILRHYWDTQYATHWPDYDTTHFRHYCLHYHITISRQRIRRHISHYGCHDTYATHVIDIIFIPPLLLRWLFHWLLIFISRRFFSFRRFRHYRCHFHFLSFFHFAIFRYFRFSFFRFSSIIFHYF